MASCSYSDVDDIRKLIRVKNPPRPKDKSWLAIVVLNIARLSSLIFKIIQLGIEGTLNFLNANGSLFQMLKEILFSRDLIDAPDPDSVQYLSIVAHQDPRVKLYMDLYATPARFPHAPPDSVVTSDVCVMASKLAYENKAVVTRVVEHVWQMNLVKYACYYNGEDFGYYLSSNFNANLYFRSAEYINMKDTQVFVCTDRKRKAILVSFRGTEMFNAFDWATDFYFEPIDFEKKFSIHAGFLTGLFRVAKVGQDQAFQLPANKFRLMEAVVSPRWSPFLARDEQVNAYYGLTDLLYSLVGANPDAKIYVTGHSLGGALAALYCALLYFKGDLKLANKLEALYTFGQPRIGDNRFAHYLYEKLRGRYFRVVYSHDLVPRVGPDPPFRHCPPVIYYNCFYLPKIIDDQPFKNFWDFPVIWTRIVAMIELFVSIFGENKETNVCLLSRFMALALPRVIAHSPVNYVNAIRATRQD